MAHEAFHYQSLADVRSTSDALGTSLPLSEDLSALFAPLTIGGHTANNRIAFQPMEGTDGTADGAPGELTRRRYLRFAHGGPGLIWFEAVATVPEARASAHQLRITQENLDQFKRLVDEIRETSLKANGYAPIIIMQATNSGRYSKPQGFPEPLIAYNCPPLEDTPLDASRILSDDTLRRYEAAFGPAARLAQKAGFDGVDVKCCHRYLACELLSAFTRPGKYGGSFENRTRFLRESIQAAKAAVSSDFCVASRLNIYDGFPYPYGFGVSENGGVEPELSEAVKLVGILHKDLGLPLLDITIGNPYFNPHVNRPADLQPYESPEDPLVGVARMLACTKTIQDAYPDLVLIGSGLSYLRQFAPQLAAGGIENGYFKLAGFGRLSFADPDFPREVLAGRELDPRKCCITCGKCTQLMRFGSMAGCVVRDPVYTRLYQENVNSKEKRV